MRARPIVLFGFLLLAAVVLCGSFLLWAWEPEIAAIEPPGKASFDPSLVKEGAELAAIGNCNVCHTTQGGKPFAGARAMPTPFGTVYASNITPDPDTGIGRWTEVAFDRAMRQGVNRLGQHLYPAFPYDHFAKLRDDDVRAIYAFLMTRDPVRQETPANDLRFPLNLRPMVAGWKLLFFHTGDYQPDPSRDAQWNRGAYLVDGLGHCGACHTPRNLFGAERRARHLAGGAAEGWHAPALNGQSPAPLAWTADSLFAYLHHGWDEAHGVPEGPMAPVGHNLAQASAADVRAISIYVASMLARPSADRPKQADEVVARVTKAKQEIAPPQLGDRGSSSSAMFTGACAGCHPKTGTSGSARGLNLALSTAVNGPDPRNAVRSILGGVHSFERERAPFMPGFATMFTDRQIADLVVYIRWRFTTQPPWRDVEDRVHEIRAGGEKS